MSQPSTCLCASAALGRTADAISMLAARTGPAKRRRRIDTIAGSSLRSGRTRGRPRSILPRRPGDRQKGGRLDPGQLLAEVEDALDPGLVVRLGVDAHDWLGAGEADHQPAAL